jgi:ATP-binding cassette, subfamily B, bacterial
MPTEAKAPAKPRKPGGPSVMAVLAPYKGWVTLLVVLALLSNGLNLVIPQLIRRGIDAYVAGTLDMGLILWEFAGASALIFLFTYLLNVVQIYASEKVALDLRARVTEKISLQSFAFIQEKTPATLLTNLTSDVDAVKTFVAQAVAAIISSLLLIVGSSILLLLIDWRLALAVLGIIPIIGGMFYFTLRRVRALFLGAQQVIDKLNKVINESILGSALIRVFHSQHEEYNKFLAANTDAKDIGMQILRMFASMIPFVTIVANAAGVIILLLGGYFVIGGSMTLGSFAAFNSYLAILIFPIFVIGFMSNVMARASASYGRILAVISTEPRKETGTVTMPLQGDIEMKNVSLSYGEKAVLKNVSFSAPPASTLAIIGPVSAGKTQLLHLLIGLTRPDKGTVQYDGHALDEYDKEALHRQIGFVFQDSVLFNLTLRENIAFSSTVSDADMQKALQTAELADFVKTLPQGLETVVSERGTSLSGGQKQRIMLARALALNPKILLLDDFTARVDTRTEQAIVENVRKNYPDLTLVSVTQKIGAAATFDQIVLLMEGEVLASGTHETLLETSPEYAQIAQSQRSTTTYDASPH